MTSPESASPWTTDIPAAWPSAPADMTVTTLVDMEGCPRRWAMSAAEYPALWQGRGYPPPLNSQALAGTVVHMALETVSRALVQAGCQSVQDPCAPQVMGTLGGYTKVVSDCIELVLSRLATNPRAAPLLEGAGRALRTRVPDFRMRLQTILCRTRLPNRATSSGPTYEARTRRPLPFGSFSEIEFRAPALGWKGKADLLLLTEAACEIIDFKTGAHDEKHRFQLEVYALLWSRDRDLNPTGRLANRLVLRYEAGDLEVPAPTATYLDELERTVVARRAAAHLAVSSRPPEARPHPDTCRYCGVRQLCDRYWVPKTLEDVAGSSANRDFGDLEVLVSGRHGPSSWDAVFTLGAGFHPGKHALVRTRGNHVFRSGYRLRILNASIAMDIDDDASPVAVTLSSQSEVFVVG